MPVNDSPFKRHSRAQGIVTVDSVHSRPSASLELTPPPTTLSKDATLRRSRVVRIRQTPSWIQSKGEAAASSEAGNVSSRDKSPVPLRQVEASASEISVSEINKSGTAQGKAESPSAPVRRVDASLVPKSTWVDYVKLGTLVQGGRELLVCCSRKDQRLFMLKDVGIGANSRVEKISTLQHRHIVLASFFIDSESTSYMAFEYTRHTLEELLHTHVKMNEDHIRAIALPVMSIDRERSWQLF